MNVDRLANTEVLARVLNIGFTHFRDREESAKASIELNDGTPGEDSYYGTYGLDSGGCVLVRCHNGEVGVDQSFLERQPQPSLGGVGGKNLILTIRYYRDSENRV